MSEDIIIEIPTEVISIEMTPEGKDGQDGFSPIAAVSKSGKTATITITDKTGTTTASVTDGEDGQPGPPGTTTWEGITDKPESFPPSPHTHTVTDITDFPTLGTMSAEDADDYYDKDAVDDALDTKAPVIVNSTSGAIAHITDAAAMPVESLTIGIEPVQDLHGYDSPWPAGGGKNLFGGNFGELFALHIPSGTTLVAYSDTKTIIRYYASDGVTEIDYWTVNNERTDGFTKKFTTNAEAFYFKFEMVTGYAAATKMYIAAENDFSGYTPYSNECPISGHSTAVVTRTGGNLWDKTTYPLTVGPWVSLGNGQITTSAITYACTEDYVPFALPVGTIVNLNHTPSGTWPGMAFYDSNKNFISGGKGNAITVPFGCAYMRFTVDEEYSDGNDVQWEIGSTATAYEPYQGQIVTINLGDERYSGTVDVKTGVLTVMWKPQILDDNVPISNDGYRNLVERTDSYTVEYGNYRNDGAIGRYSIPSDKFAPYETSSLTNIPPYSVSTATDLPRLYLSFPKTYDTLEKIQAWFGNNPTQVVYPLAEPFTVQLTPAELSLLYGENNVWASTGDVNVGYRADTRLYIDRKIAELQALILDN